MKLYQASERLQNALRAGNGAAYGRDADGRGYRARLQEHDYVVFRVHEPGDPETEEVSRNYETDTEPSDVEWRPGA